MNEQDLTDLLHKFRDEVASSLQFQPSIELLMDNQFCSSIVRQVHKTGILWERKIAVDSLGYSLPDVTGLYMFVWRPTLEFRFDASREAERLCWILYIGKAGTEGGSKDTIRNRYLSEYSKYVGKDPSCLWDQRTPTSREDRLARYLTLRPLEYWFLEIDHIPDIPILERKLIRMMQPPLNRHHGPKIRLGKPVPISEEPK